MKEKPQPNPNDLIEAQVIVNPDAKRSGREIPILVLSKFKPEEESK